MLGKPTVHSVPESHNIKPFGKLKTACQNVFVVSLLMKKIIISEIVSII
jgi:hypothetical protein